MPASSLPYPRPAILGPVAPRAPPHPSTQGNGLQEDEPWASCIHSSQNVGLGVSPKPRMSLFMLVQQGMCPQGLSFAHKEVLDSHTLPRN
jgi:hypothetical protein